MPIDPRMVKWEEQAAPVIDPRMVKWEEEKPQPSKREQADAALGKVVGKVTNYDPTNLNAGMVRGAGSIGSTLIRPFESADANAQRRDAIDSGLTSLVGSDPNSTQYKTGKFMSEVAGTSGAGGLLGKAAQTVGLSAPVSQGLVSGGLDVAGKTGLGGLLTRFLTGGVTGAATAGLIDPKDAATGAVVGAVVPVAALGAGRIGEKLGKMQSDAETRRLSEYNRNAPKNETIKSSVEAGYVIPPNMVDPSFKNQVVESISGKQATQQVFSGKNEKVTGSLVRKSLGLPDDAPLTKKTLEDLRRTAGKDYSNIAALSKQASDDLEALKRARNEANGWFTAYNRSARPDDLAKAKEFRAMADELENALEQHAVNAGRPDLIPAYRDARKLIAKTYNVERALNDAAGTVDARVLGRLYEKGVPLSDGLDVAGRFASAFPTVAKSTQQVGSEAAHNLKSLASLGLGIGGGATFGLAGGLSAAVPFVAPPVARSAMLSKGTQQSLVRKPPKISDKALSELLMNQELQRLVARTAPVAAAN